jgi:hypothetical protein
MPCTLPTHRGAAKLWQEFGAMCVQPHRLTQAEPNITTQFGSFGRAKEEIMEAPRIGIVTLELQLDWDRIGVLFASFGIACGGIATVVYSIGFLVQALTHHV